MCSNLFFRFVTIGFFLMTSLTCCMSIVMSPPWGSLSFPAYLGSAFVKIMPSSLLPLVFICFSHPWHFLLLKLESSTKLHLHCRYISLSCVAFATILHFQTLTTCQATTWLVITRTAAGHPSSVLLQAFICLILLSLPLVLILSPVVPFDLDLKLNYAFDSISRLLRAHRPSCILHWFYKTRAHVICVYR